MPKYLNFKEALGSFEQNFVLQAVLNKILGKNVRNSRKVKESFEETCK